MDADGGEQRGQSNLVLFLGIKALNGIALRFIYINGINKSGGDHTVLFCSDAVDLQIIDLGLQTIGQQLCLAGQLGHGGKRQARRQRSERRG